MILMILASTALKSNDYLELSSAMMFRVYHNYISPVKGSVSHCQFSPSCSEYSRQSIKEYGFSIGVIMTADRLMRCSGGHASNEDYPYSNALFVDKPQNQSLFGDGKQWSIGLGGGTATTTNQVDTTFSFAHHLFESNELQLCKLELIRIKYYTKDKKVNDKANLLLASNEFLTSKNIKALDYMASIDSLTDKSMRYKYVILSYLISDARDLNEFNIYNLQAYYDSSRSETFDKLLAYSYYKNSDLDSSIKMVKYISNKYKSPGYDSITTFMQDNYDKHIKSPLLAGVFSTILPGSGYIYAGRTNEGLSAFLVNSLLGVGIYALFKNGNTGSGILTSLVAFPFYIGNIVGAANAAEALNNKHKLIVLANLRNSLGISFQFSTQQIAEFWE